VIHDGTIASVDPITAPAVLAGAQLEVQPLVASCPHPGSPKRGQAPDPAMRPGGGQLIVATLLRGEVRARVASVGNPDQRAAGQPAPDRPGGHAPLPQLLGRCQVTEGAHHEFGGNHAHILFGAGSSPPGPGRSVQSRRRMRLWRAGRGWRWRAGRARVARIGT
jgi:hypothetical protein